MTDTIRAALERMILDLDAWCETWHLQAYTDPRISLRLIADRARTALAEGDDGGQAEQLQEVWARLYRGDAMLGEALHREGTTHPQHDTELVDRARAALAEEAEWRLVVDDSGRPVGTLTADGKLTSPLAEGAGVARPIPVAEQPKLAHEAYVAFVQICKGGSDDAGTYEADEALVRQALKRLDELEQSTTHPRPVPMADEDTLLQAVKSYIEKAEERIDGEWGSCRTLKELLDARQMPDVYWQVLNRLAEQVGSEPTGAHPRPIPVAERPWEREGFCDAEGRCWFLDPFLVNGWFLWIPDPEIKDMHVTHCLPAAAIPLPEVEK